MDLGSLHISRLRLIVLSTQSSFIIFACCIVFISSGQILQTCGEMRMGYRKRVSISVEILCKSSFLFASFEEAAGCHSSLIERTSLKTNPHLFQLRAIQNIPRG